MASVSSRHASFQPSSNIVSSPSKSLAPSRSAFSSQAPPQYQDNNTTSSRMTTPLAPPPPPPLYMSSHEHGSGPERQVRYAGADHTLGPTFSEEEDGDDTAFIAAKMAALGLDPNGMPYRQPASSPFETRASSTRDSRSRTPLTHAQQRQLHMQQLAQIQSAQQQQALFHLLSQQNANPQLREALTILEIQQQQHQQLQQQHQQYPQERHGYARQQAQRAHAANIQRQQEQYEQKRYSEQRQQQQQQEQIQQMRYLQDMHLQQQLAALQPGSYAPPGAQRDQRSALAAQMQANLKARTGRVAEARGMSLDDAELRARFEAASAPLYTPPVEPRSRFETSPVASYSVSTSPTAASWSRSMSESPSPTKTTIVTPVEVSAPPLATGSIRSPKGGRFAQARKEMAAEGDMPLGTLTATLSKRSLNNLNNVELIKKETTEVNESFKPLVNQAAPSVAEERPLQTGAQSASTSSDMAKPARYTLGALGKGRPATLGSSVDANHRSITLPGPNGASSNSQINVRSASQPFVKAPTMFVVRQPYGPPGEAKDLGDKNFQSRLRRQAGLKLGMLGRRVESPCPTPVLG